MKNNLDEDYDPCPICGTKFDLLVNEFRFGCKNCYDHFEEMTKYIISIAQNDMNVQYVGEPPESYKNQKCESLTFDFFINEVNFKIKDLIKKEKYEEVVILKNKIDKLKEKLGDKSELFKIAYDYYFPKSI